LKKNSFLKIFLALIILIQLSPVFSVSAENIMAEFHVALSGDDNASGSLSSPFKTVAKARDAVRQINKNMTGDIYVYIHEGTYTQPETLIFDDRDSGTNGHRIIYTAYENDEAIISGGRKVEGWKPSSLDGIWEVSDFSARAVGGIYVNGVSGKIAQNETLYTTKEMYNNEEDSLYSWDGFTTDANLSGYKNQSDILVSFDKSWKTLVFSVESIFSGSSGDSVINIHSEIFDGNQAEGHKVEPNIHFRLMNAFEELDTEGEFYYDKSASKLYYKPRENEDMTSAEVYIPELEEIVRIYGSDMNHKAKNISFKNLTFRDGTWYRGLEEGFVVQQSSEISLPTHLKGKTDEPDRFIIPASIRLNAADSIEFSGNKICGMLGAGIGYYHGVDNSKIVGNVFSEIGDAAVSIGTTAQAYESAIHSGFNLSEGKPVTSNDKPSNSAYRGYLSYYAPQAAVEPTKNIGWSSAGVAGLKPYIQIDLLDEYEIDRIEIDGRTSSDQAMTRANFKLLGSNDKDFKDYEVLAEQGAEEFPHATTKIFNITTSTPYRYIRLERTYANYYMYVQEIRVINESMEYCPKYRVCKKNEVSNNYVTRAAFFNHSAAGIQAYFADGLDITHNEVYELPCCGIVTGWGWSNYLDTQTSRNINVNYNEIHDTMQTMFDGGGFYNLGPQINSSVSNNHFYNQNNLISAIYLDQGSRYFTVKNNVIENSPYAFVSSTYNGGYNTFDNNFTTCMSSTDKVSGEGVSFSEPIRFIPGNYPAEAIDIVKNAGVKPEYRDNFEKLDSRPFDVDESLYYDNPIHITVYEVLNDSRFKNWYLKNYIEMMETVRSLAVIGDGLGEYDESDLAEFDELIAECEAAYAKEQIDRYEIMELKDRAQALCASLASKRNTLPFSELIELAEDELTSAIENGTHTDAQINAFTSDLQRAEKAFESGEDADLEALYLEKKYINFVGSKTGGISSGKELKNVALNKPVVVTATQFGSASALTDGDLTAGNYWIAYNSSVGAEKYNGKNHAIIDLGKEYEIEKITVYDRGGTNTDGTRGNFSILGSNNPKGDYVEIASLDYNAEGFPKNGSVDFVLDEPASYRYIRYQRNSIDAAQLREIEVFAKDDVIDTENICLNVARNKKITVSATEYGSLENINDDDLLSGNYWIAYRDSVGAEKYYGENWFTVDLEKRYPIEKIVLFDRGGTDTSSMRGSFKILGANKSDFSDGVELFSTSDLSAEEFEEFFPKNGSMTLNLPDKTPYRYIKYQKFNVTAAQIREIQIFATVTATNIARNKATYSTPSFDSVQGNSYSASYGHERLVDGDLTTNWQSAASDNTTYFGGEKIGSHYASATLDLGAEYPVDAVRLYAAQNAAEADRGYFALYTSRNPVTANDMSDLQADTKRYYNLTHSELTALTDYDYTPLVYSNSAPQSVSLSDGTTYVPFETSPGGYTLALNAESPFRYLTYRKTSTAYQGVLSEIKAYVINPFVSQTDVDYNNITVSFSDEMNPSSLSPDTVSVIDMTDFSEVDIASLSYSSYNLYITANGLVSGREYMIRIDDSVTNEKNIQMANSYTETFTAENAMSDFTLTPKEELKGGSLAEAHMQYYNYNNEGESKAFTIFAAIYKEGRLLSAGIDSKTVSYGGLADFTATVRLPDDLTGVTVKAFLWDGNSMIPIVPEKSVSAIIEDDSYAK